MKTQISKIKKERKEKYIYTNIFLFVMTLAYVLWGCYFLFGGALGWVWNPINKFAIPYIGFHGTVQEAWDAFSILNTFHDNVTALMSLLIIGVLVGFQLVMLIEAMMEVQRLWFKQFVFWLTNDKVIMRSYGFRMNKSLKSNSGNTLDALSEAEENHWKKWKEYYKSDMSFDEWKRKNLKR